MRWTSGFCLLLGLLTASRSGAQSNPWVADGDAPVPRWAHSVRILEHDEPLSLRPAPDAQRRGSAARGARLPLYAARRAPGCEGRWLLVGPLAWVCEDRVELSRDRAIAAPSQPQRIADGLPYRYHFVGSDGSLGYTRLASAEEGTPDAELEPGFAVAVRRVGRKPDGDPFGLTTKGVWVPMRDLTPARTFLFEGESLTERGLDVAWVYRESAEVFRSPGGARLRDVTLTRFESLTVLETRQHRGRNWLRIGADRWVSDRDVRFSALASPPQNLRTGERWVDVDLGQQILTAYEGDRPLFATLVSTGRGRPGTEESTPTGEFRIWVKLRSSDMDNLESDVASRYYAIQDVPWVMYFERGYGLHGTFWHRGFGQVRSHGCVNLSPLAAQRLFHWTSPRVPAGWTAALPTPHEPGTLVRIR